MFRRGTKNVVAIFLFLAHLILVEGQALYVLSDLAETSEPVFYADNVIRLRSFTLANITLTASVIVICISYHLAGKKSRLARAAKWPELHETLFSYITVVSVMSAACYALIQKLGGFRSFYYSMGTMVGGQVLLMIAVSFGKLPLLHKTASGMKPKGMDWLLFGVAMSLIMLNSRGIALLMVLQYVVVMYFSRRTNGGTVRVFLRVAVAGFLIVMVYGAVRDFVTPRGTFEGLVDYYFVGSGTDRLKVLTMGDLFYRFMTSAFTGLAGILNTYLESGVDHDFGITNLSLLTHLVPYGLRTAVLSDLDDWIISLSRVSGSVVPGGYEIWFVHLGFPGILLFSILLGTLPQWLHGRLVAVGADRLKYGILAVHVLNLLLTPLWTMTFWLLADLCLLFTYRVVLSAGMHFEPRAALEPIS